MDINQYSAHRCSPLGLIFFTVCMSVYVSLSLVYTCNKGSAVTLEISTVATVINHPPILVNRYTHARDCAHICCSVFILQFTKPEISPQTLNTKSKPLCEK